VAVHCELNATKGLRPDHRNRMSTLAARRTDRRYFVRVAERELNHGRRARRHRLNHGATEQPIFEMRVEPNKLA
jgi:hypothetical protein